MCHGHRSEMNKGQSPTRRSFFHRVSHHCRKNKYAKWTQSEYTGKKEREIAKKKERRRTQSSWTETHAYSHSDSKIYDNTITTVHVFLFIPRPAGWLIFWTAGTKSWGIYFNLVCCTFSRWPMPCHLLIHSQRKRNTGHGAPIVIAIRNA